jgi:hypothetical protein
VGDFDTVALAMVESSVKYHFCMFEILTQFLESGLRTVLYGQFGWGGLLLKSNGGVQRDSQYGWLSYEECKGIRILDCETYTSSRCESRS